MIIARPVKGDKKAKAHVSDVLSLVLEHETSDGYNMRVRSLRDNYIAKGYSLRKAKRTAKADIEALLNPVRVRARISSQDVVTSDPPCAVSVLRKLNSMLVDADTDGIIMQQRVKSVSENLIAKGHSPDDANELARKVVFSGHRLK